MTKQTQGKRNINVEIDIDLHYKLRMIAFDSGTDFHNYIRTVLLKEVDNYEKRKTKR